MLILAVDTSTPAGSVAALRDSTVLGQVGYCSDEAYSSRLFRDLGVLLRDVGLQLREVDVFAVCAGPGSFTGLRVGLAAAKGWAEAFGKPIATVSGLEAVAAQAKSPSSLLAPVMDARRGQVYGGLFERGSGELFRVADEMVLAPAEFLAWLRERGGSRAATLVTPTPEVLSDAMRVSADRGFEVETVSAVLAPVVGRLGYARALRGELVDALSLDANYVRRSDAEILWKG